MVKYAPRKVYIRESGGYVEFELGFKELIFTTKPEVMRIGYSLYKRLGYEELSEENGIVSMRIDLSKEYPYG